MMLATLWQLHKYFMSNSRNQGKGNFNDSKINNLMYYSRNFALLQQPTCIIRKRTLNFYWKGSLAENTPLKTQWRDWLALMIKNLNAYPCQLRFSMMFPILWNFKAVETQVAYCQSCFSSVASYIEDQHFELDVLNVCQQT